MDFHQSCSRVARAGNGHRARSPSERAARCGSAPLGPDLWLIEQGTREPDRLPPAFWLLPDDEHPRRHRPTAPIRELGPAEKKWFAAHSAPVVIPPRNNPRETPAARTATSPRRDSKRPP